MLSIAGDWPLGSRISAQALELGAGGFISLCSSGNGEGT